jgi:hypothetical protein
MIKNARCDWREIKFLLWWRAEFLDTKEEFAVFLEYGVHGNHPYGCAHRPPARHIKMRTNNRLGRSLHARWLHHPRAVRSTPGQQSCLRPAGRREGAAAAGGWLRYSLFSLTNGNAV